MPEELYIIPIVALLPGSALTVVLQQNPYHALIMRGILGAIAALVYALLGAADVSLTEAMVGTMLSITLYAIAVRSSLSMRLGVLSTTAPESILPPLRQILHKYHMRLEVVPYTDETALKEALCGQEVHAICLPEGTAPESPYPIEILTRIPRLYYLMEKETESLSCSVGLHTPQTAPSSRSEVLQ